MPTRIVVVDDDQDTLRLLKLILQNAGMQPVLTENGRDALAAIALQTPDLVLCDVLMPIFDGYETLLAIRNEPRTKDLPVLMLSALGQEKDVQRALAAGANGYIIKPFSLRFLVAQINSLLAEITR